MSVPSLDGRIFAVVDMSGGVATTDTVFRYAEADGVVTATYEGGTIRSGFLVGTRDRDSLDFRYAQLHEDGSTATGHWLLPRTPLRRSGRRRAGGGREPGRVAAAVLHSFPPQRRQSRHLRSLPASTPAKPAPTLSAGSVEPTPVRASVEPTAHGPSRTRSPVP